jgi:hypothetical protein
VILRFRPSVYIAVSDNRLEKNTSQIHLSIPRNNKYAKKKLGRSLFLPSKPYS